jgi:hypothetical protein
MSLLRLTPELLATIAAFIYDPDGPLVNNGGILVGRGPFRVRRSGRLKDFGSLLSFAETCHRVRRVCSPLIFSSITIQSYSKLVDVAKSDWKVHVQWVPSGLPSITSRTLRPRFDMFDPKDSRAAHPIFRGLFPILPKLEHVELDTRYGNR